MRGLAWRPDGEGCGGENKDVNVPRSRASLGRARSWRAGGYLARSVPREQGHTDTCARGCTDTHTRGQTQTHTGTARTCGRSHAPAGTDRHGHAQRRGHAWGGAATHTGGAGGRAARPPGGAAIPRTDPSRGSAPGGRPERGAGPPGSGIPRSAGHPGSGTSRGSGVPGKQDPRGPRPTGTAVGAGPLAKRDSWGSRAGGIRCPAPTQHPRGQPQAPQPSPMARCGVGATPPPPPRPAGSGHSSSRPQAWARRQLVSEASLAPRPAPTGTALLPPRRAHGCCPTAPTAGLRGRMPLHCPWHGGF